MKTVVLGAGLAGLSAAYILSKNKKDVVVLEKDKVVGGLSRTIYKNGYRFDLGGHRFWTKKEELNIFLKNLMGDDLLDTKRISKIYLMNKYFDYPLKPTNAIFSMGFSNTVKILADYLYIKLKKSKIEDSFECWIVNRFGRKMFELYFKPYTEKVWGIPCTEISAAWAAQRIKGMSLKSAAFNAFFGKFKKNKVATLVEQFMYPKLGIGMIAERLAKNTKVKLNAEVKKVNHTNDKIISIKTNKGIIKGDNFISSIPLTELVKKMNAPAEIIKDAKKLTYRDLIMVFIMLNKEKVTNDTWMYFPNKNIIFGRMHEPKNWSKYMVKEGTTSLGFEIFCTEGDEIWKEEDGKLINMCINDAEKLGFIKREEIIYSGLIKVKKAYPIYNIDYTKHLEKIKNYLKKFKNLQLIGRNGLFQYNNMDHVIEMGIKAAKNILGEHYNVEEIGTEGEYFEVKKFRKPGRNIDGFYRTV